MERVLSNKLAQERKYEPELAHSRLELAHNLTPVHIHHFGHHAACRTVRPVRRSLKVRTLRKQLGLLLKIDSSETPY